ncbi:hypothetical protein [Mucilaginibacter sp. SP1R1]|uniref:hypothetical protein n=1 Tax=Mucilaginibacter sp. SP1R1 TaxID=2723091 RepID=UPI00161338C2|nr:hypothetical protein [Mucilaginibacter sp. SP1R1]MBB6151226.1 hypothetical protein [Mucilaginibacter sp. SP1R1]
MKKILTLVCCTILIAATSCTKKYITPANITAIYTINGTTGWEVYTDSGGNKSYRSPLKDLPEQDQYAQENGGVLVYISYDKGVTYEALPQTYNGIAYSYTSSVGVVTIYAQNSDGTQLSAAPSSDIKVKVVLVDSSQ